MSDIVHLRAYSEYSLLYSAARVSDLAAAAVDAGMRALGVVHRGGMFGAIACHQTLQKARLTSLMAYETTIVEDRARNSVRQSPSTMLFFAESAAGYGGLTGLATLAAQSGDLDAVCNTWEELSTHAQGLLCLVGAVEGPLAQAAQTANRSQAVRVLSRLTEVFGADHVYVELQSQGLPEDRARNEWLAEIARGERLPVVATTAIRHIHPQDVRLLDVLAGIHAGQDLEAAAIGRAGVSFHFRTQEDMRRLFGQFPAALAATAEIASRADFVLPLNQRSMPRFPLPAGRSEDDMLRELARRGLAMRNLADRADCVARLDHELTVIRQMGFSGYFLIVWDFMRHAHEQGISTGPGRGSAAGSLVSYALHITDVDPMAHDLLFERFLNPERVSWPDIDIDFETERRYEVIAYVARKYGADCVAQIGTLGTFAARAAIRDVARVLKTPSADIESFVRRIPAMPGVTIESALQGDGGLRSELGKSPALRRVVDLAVKIEGLPRHASVHAAGVVISHRPLAQFVPLMQGIESTPVTQYGMDDIASLGLLKMDFLGLRTLTLCDRAKAYVERMRGEQITYGVTAIRQKVSSHSSGSPEHIMDHIGHGTQTIDERTAQLLADGDTDGCFQLESVGVRQVLRELRPTTLEDLIAVISLYRPGPMEQIGAFIDARRGRKPVVVEVPALEPILRPTYGILIYQEQIMQIASVMAGFSLGEADVLRRAVGKKQRDVMDRARDSFVRGCIAHGHDDHVANQVYDLIVRFADYGFPRSHAAAYAVLAHRTAYLKANYRPEFMAALMSDSVSRPEKIAQYAQSCRRNGIAVLPPDLNKSAGDCLPEVLADGRIGVRLGLFAVKNVGVTAVQHIVDERASGGLYSSVQDVQNRLDSRSVSKRVMESLVAAGALDGFGRARKTLLAELQTPARHVRAGQAGRQLSLLDAPGDDEREGRGGEDDGREDREGRGGERTGRVGRGEIEGCGGESEGGEGSGGEAEGRGGSGGEHGAARAANSRKLSAQERDDPRQIAQWERDLIGFVVSYDAFAHVTAAAKRSGLPPIQEQLAMLDGKTGTAHGAFLKIVGQVAAVRTVRTKKGETMAFLTMEDSTARVDIVAFPAVFRLLERVPEPTEILLLSVRRDENRPTALIANQITKYTERADACLYIHVDEDVERQRAKLAQLRERLLAHPGDTSVVLVYASGKMRPLGALKVRITDDLLDMLRAIAGRDSVRVV